MVKEIQNTLVDFVHKMKRVAEPRLMDPSVYVNFKWDRLSTDQVEVISRLASADMQPILKLVLAMKINELNDEIFKSAGGLTIEETTKKTLINAGIREGFNHLIWLGEEAKAELKKRMPSSSRKTP